MIIGDLGNQETLLIACDDGDVAAISIRQVHQAALRNNTNHLDENVTWVKDLRPFFIRNVGASAWGLAIHKEARLLAVSANTHDITIFAFALQASKSNSCSDSEEGTFQDCMDDSMDDADWSPYDADRVIYEPDWKMYNATCETRDPDWNPFRDTSAPAPERSENLQIILRGHATNIPSVAFCNTSADTQGMYLVSADISGRNIVWGRSSHSDQSYHPINRIMISQSTNFMVSTTKHKS